MWQLMIGSPQTREAELAGLQAPPNSRVQWTFIHHSATLPGEEPYWCVGSKAVSSSVSASQDSVRMTGIGRDGEIWRAMGKRGGGRRGSPQEALRCFTPLPHTYLKLGIRGSTGSRPALLQPAVQLDEAVASGRRKQGDTAHTAL